jgi:hypothetical protein
MEKFKAGDMVTVETENSIGIGFVYNTYPEQPECGVLRVSVAWSNGGCSDGFAITEFKKIEKSGVLTEEKGKSIIRDLDELTTGLEMDKNSVGLSLFDCVDHTGEMVYQIRLGLIGETVEANFNDLYHHSLI